MGVIVFTDQRRNVLLAMDNFEADALVSLGSPALLRLPAGPAFLPSQDTLIVPGSGNDRLVYRDWSSGSWSTFGSSGAGKSELKGPTGVATDALDRIYIVDAGNHRLVCMNNLVGNGWTAYGSAGRPTAADPIGKGLFAAPRGVAIDSMGRIVVTDPSNGRIVRFHDMSGRGMDSSSSALRREPAAAVWRGGGRSTDCCHRRG